MESLLDILNTGDGDDDNNHDEMPNLFTHSPYFDSASAIKVMKSTNGSPSILSLNCQSFQSKFDQLLIYLQLFEDANCPFSIICLQETWLKDNYDVSLLQLEGYNFIHASSYCSAHELPCILEVTLNIESNI